MQEHTHVGERSTTFKRLFPTFSIKISYIDIVLYEFGCCGMCSPTDPLTIVKALLFPPQIAIKERMVDDDEGDGKSQSG